MLLLSVEFNLRQLYRLTAWDWPSICLRAKPIIGLPCWLRQSRICLQCRRPGFSPWVGKVPWRREWLPTLLPGKSRGQSPGRPQSLGLRRVGHDWRLSVSASAACCAADPRAFSSHRPETLSLLHNVLFLFFPACSWKWAFFNMRRNFNIKPLVVA